MKNVDLNIFKSMRNASSALLVALLMTISFAAKADIIGLDAQVQNGYQPGTTSTVEVSVFFDSNTAESADFIEFRLSGPVAGLSLWHGTPSPIPYSGCGGNKGMEMTATGPGWGTPMMMNGNSQCGAFEGGMIHTFGIDVQSDGSFTGSFGLEVRVVGDGNGETEASESILEVMVQPIICTIMCPTDITLTASGDCSLAVNVPSPVLTGDCGMPIAGVNDMFPVGTTPVVYATTDGNGNDVSCTTMVTIIDDEDPVVLGADNITESLGSGGCGVIIPQNFTVSENCDDPALILTQSNDLSSFDAGYNCVGGPTKYIRVFDAASEGIDTEFNIEEVTFGVLEAFGSPYVTVNVYRVDGTPTYANMELIGTGGEILPSFENALYSIPLTATAVVSADETFAVEIVVPGSQFNGIIVAMNQGGESAPSYLASDFCGITEPTAASTLGFGSYATVMSVEGYETGVLLVPVGDSPEIGDTATIGVTQVNYQAIDANGNATDINFTVTVQEFDDPLSAIICNDEVQVSLDDDCMTVVTADLILEGGPYGCFDSYIVEIEDADGNTYGNTVTADNIGQELIVRVTSPGANSCWGTLIVEDKFPAELECMDIFTTCTGDIFPGSPISDIVTFPANFNQFNANISATGTSANIYTFPVNGLINATTTNIGVRLNIEHEAVSDLNATLQGPDGTTVTLFIAPGTDCQEDGLQIVLDDSAFNTNADLADTCRVGEVPSITGTYQPMQALNIFDGKDPNGDWLLTISDTQDGNGGTVVAAELVVSQSGGVVSFPTEEDIVFQTEGDNTFTVNGIDACGSASLTYMDNEIEQDCSSPYSQVVQRTWNAIDASGNESTACTQTIYIFRNGLATLMFPPNYDDVQNPSLSCDDFGDMVPPTSVTGEPSGDLCDNVQIFPYTDTRIDICQGSYKLVRHFQLLEWCSGEVVEHNQIIKVTDKEGPQLADIEDVTISAGEIECAGDYVGAFPEVTSDCSDEFIYKLSVLAAYDGGQPPVDGVYFDDNVTITSSAAIARDLAFGRTWARWDVTDECGNTTTEFFTITVEDQVSPIAVCDEFTTVSIGADGYVEVYATTFDDGSLDNCGILDMKARKLTNSCSGVSTAFGDVVTFCCSEVGETVMVEFQVTDLSGNENTCMVEVSIQDKLPPYITVCPPDITLDCQADYSDPATTGEPEFIDNCEVVAVNFVDDENLDNCGSGTVRRTWTVEDREGFKATCVQTITLEDDEPFEEDDITWPRDYDATTCDTNLEPDNLPLVNAYPRYDDDNCSLVATVYEDRVFTFVDGACEKILREWTVIDWCTYNEINPVEGEGYYKHLQVIKLKNTEAPVISNCTDTNAPVFGECEGMVSYTLEAEDDCTPTEDLLFSYQIDLFQDGIDALDAFMTADAATFNRVLPIGLHTVSWTVADKCGNTEFCSMDIIVEDAKKPTPYCLSSITTVVMNNNGMVDIWASDFDLGSYDNCTPTEELRVSFSQNPNMTSRTFSCNDLPNGEEEEIQVEMWVTDNAGNQDFCSIILILQDSQDDACDGTGNGNLVSISGEILTEEFEELDNANVITSSTALDITRTVQTDAQGEYSSDNLPIGAGYNVRASKNDDVNNGVSTLDLVFIQRHILGLAELDSPYKLIASDINNDGKIKASDLLSLRKVILGVVAEFPNDQESWRFVPKNTAFADPANPFPFNENIALGMLEHSSINNDLIGIKIGDVNGSVSANLRGESTSDTRSYRTMTLAIDNHALQVGSTVDVPVYATDVDVLTGYQATIDLDGATFVSIESGQMDVTESNVASVDDALTMSWADANGVEINVAQPLFTLTLEVNAGQYVSDIMDINSNVISAEAYDESYETMNIELETRSVELETQGFALFQNRPNPFLEYTNIKFYLPEAGEVELMITDVTGKLVTKKVQQYEAGTQNIEINYNDLQTSGVLYYTIKSGAHIATKKMINIR